MSKKIFVDFYGFLEIAENASMEEIRKAYKKKMILYHPDNQIGKSEEEQKIAKINCERASEALETLSDPKKRKVFDLERNRRKQSTTSNKKTSTQTSSSSYSSAEKHTQYSEEEDIAFDGTFEEYVEFMKRKKREEEKETSNSTNNSNKSKNSTSQQQSRFDEYMFRFFTNFTDTYTTGQRNYKFYRQKTSKAQKTTFKKEYANSEKNTNKKQSAFTHENVKNKNTQRKEETPNFSEIIQLEKRVQELNKELQELGYKSSELAAKSNSLYNQIQNVNQYTDISEKVAGNLTYKEAKEYIAKHNQRTKKFITKLFISKEDWNTFFAMQRKIEQIEEEARKEITQELHEKFAEISQNLAQITERAKNKNRDYLLAKEEYQNHPLHFKYECYKMDFTKKYQTTEEQMGQKKAI